MANGSGVSGFEKYKNAPNAFLTTGSANWGNPPQPQNPTPVFTGTFDQRITSQVGETNYNHPQGFQSGPQSSQWMQAKRQYQQRPWGGRKSSKKYKSKKSSKKSRRSRKSSKKSKKSKSRRHK